MSAIRTFFRHCPACGRRFEIRLVDKRVLGSETLREERTRPEVSGGSFSTVHTVVREDIPAIVDVQEFQYRYKCNHCGHEWSEVHEEVHEVDEPKS
jgi:predicted RNA-binding Zn-ribbon protein involved in translation (DUF1610 family)